MASSPDFIAPNSDYLIGRALHKASNFEQSRPLTQTEAVVISVALAIICAAGAYLAIQSGAAWLDGATRALPIIGGGAVLFAGCALGFASLGHLVMSGVHALDYSDPQSNTRHVIMQVAASVLFPTVAALDGMKFVVRGLIIDAVFGRR